MGFKIQKRINLGKGLGFNISKSGISPSLRTKRGTVSTKGISIRTGISGVNYKNQFKSTNSSGCIVFFCISTLGFTVLMVLI